MGGDACLDKLVSYAFDHFAGPAPFEKAGYVGPNRGLFAGGGEVEAVGVVEEDSHWFRVWVWFRSRVLMSCAGFGFVDLYLHRAWSPWC